MLITQDIQDKVNTAKLYYISQVALNLAKLRVGSQASFKSLLGVKRLIQALTFQIIAGVIDVDTEKIYNCLVQALGGYGAAYALDPTVQLPGQTVVTVSVLQNWNNGQIPINTSSGSPQFLISNYNITYKDRYGNNPILAPYITAGGFNTGDEQTPPVITRVNPNDPTSDILSILYDYPVATLGYLNIWGSGGSTVGTGGNIIVQPAPPTPSDESFIFV